jgi:hypothetical protein
MIPHEQKVRKNRKKVLAPTSATRGGQNSLRAQEMWFAVAQARAELEGGPVHTLAGLHERDGGEQQEQRGAGSHRFAKPSGYEVVTSVQVEARRGM